MFFTSQDPTEAASHIDNRQITIYTQSAVRYLTTIFFEKTTDPDTKKSGIDQPVQVITELPSPISAPKDKQIPILHWLRQSRYNYNWLIHYTECLLAERCRRWPQKHPHVHAKAVDYIKQHSNAMPFPNGLSILQQRATNFPNTTTYQNGLIGLPFSAYQMYLVEKWHGYKQPPVWGLGREPWFWVAAKNRKAK